MGTLETTSSDQRSAVDKAFCLLKSFTPEDGGGVGVSELARRAHLSKSTAHRLLATLVANGAVQRAGGLYRLGSFFDELHSQSITPRHELVSEVLTPFLAALFERTRSTVHLAYLEGTQVVYANKGAVAKLGQGRKAQPQDISCPCSGVLKLSRISG